MDKKNLPISKRWPGQWAVRATIYTPNGTVINFETDLPNKAGESLLQMLTSAFARKQPEKTLKTKKRRTPVVG